MAIKIPSKNIYEINNPKIRDNVIDNVSVEQTVVTPNNDYEVPIKQYESKDFDIGTLNTSAKIKYEHNSIAGVVGQYNYALSASLVQLKTTYTKSININIEKLLKNAYISKIYDGKNYNDENNIKFTVYQTVTKQDVYMDISIPSGIQNQGEKDFTPSNIVVSKTSTTNGTNAISSDYINVENNIVQVIQNTSASISLSDASISNSISETNKENVSTIKFYTPSGKDYFTANGILVLAGLTATKMKYEYTSGGVAGIAPTSPIRLKGTREFYMPERVEITIYGDTIGIDLTDGSITYSNGKKPHSLSSNELLQDSGKTNDIAITQNLANNVLRQYANGKETATLLCDIADYYYENGEKAIDIKTNKMSFRLHDEVIPYVFGANRQDQPMSRYQDGLPKVFEVVGSNIIYDGAVWQELTLLEKSQRNS
jgi:hypothetical protein